MVCVSMKVINSSETAHLLHVLRVAGTVSVDTQFVSDDSSRLGLPLQSGHPHS